MTKRWFSSLVVSACLIALTLGIAAVAQETGGPVDFDDPIEYNAPYLSTPMKVVEKMLELAEVTRADIVYDLGSGDGRIVIAAARRYGARGIGFEIDPELVKEARLNAERAGVEDLVEFRVQDIFTADLSRASVVTLYLLPETNAILRPRLERQLQAGARIVSHDFGMGDWEPEVVREFSSPDGGLSRLSLWRVLRK